MNINKEEKTNILNLKHTNFPFKYVTRSREYYMNNKDFDIIYPKYQHRHSAVLPKRILEMGGCFNEVFEAIEEEEDDYKLIDKERRKSCYENSFKLKRKLDLIESDNFLSYKPFLSSQNISNQMDKITEVKEDIPVLQGNSPRIRILTDYLEDLTLNLKPRHSSSSPMNLSLSKNQVISEEYGENGEDNVKETKKNFLFPKLEAVIDKYEQNVIDKYDQIAEKRTITEFSEGVVIEEECTSEEDDKSPSKKVKSIETLKSDDFDKENESYYLRINKLIEEKKIIQEDDEKKIEDSNTL